MDTKDTSTNHLHPLERARLAGLHRAVEQFPEDVAFAVQSAAEVCADLAPLQDSTVEPWPNKN